MVKWVMKWVDGQTNGGKGECGNGGLKDGKTTKGGGLFPGMRFSAPNHIWPDRYNHSWLRGNKPQLPMKLYT